MVITRYYRLDKSTRNLLLTVLEVRGLKVKALTNLATTENLLPGSYMVVFLLSLHMEYNTTESLS